MKCQIYFLGKIRKKKKKKKKNQLKCENKHQKSESCHPCFASEIIDKTINEVKLTVKFYSL